MSTEGLLTVAQASRAFPIFTEASLRNLIRRAHENGLHEAIRRIRGRIYLSEAEFKLWLEK